MKLLEDFWWSCSTHWGFKEMFSPMSTSRASFLVTHHAIWVGAMPTHIIGCSVLGRWWFSVACICVSIFITDKQGLQFISVLPSELSSFILSINFKPLTVISFLSPFKWEEGKFVFGFSARLESFSVESALQWKWFGVFLEETKCFTFKWTLEKSTSHYLINFNCLIFTFQTCN